MEKVIVRRLVKTIYKEIAFSDNCTPSKDEDRKPVCAELSPNVLENACIEICKFATSCGWQEMNAAIFAKVWEKDGSFQKEKKEYVGYLCFCAAPLCAKNGGKGPCINGGVCEDAEGYEKCNCSKTNFLGTHCHRKNPCLPRNPCNEGKCSPVQQPDGAYMAECDCSEISNTGTYCEVAPEYGLGNDGSEVERGGGGEF